MSLHDETGQQKDIVEYVSSVVHSDTRMGKWREQDQNLVIETLSERANGMFRWVFCQLETLRYCFPPSLRRTLRELPESLDETYEHLLKNINRAARPHAHRLLQCLTVAVRPLRLEELAEVLAFDFGEAPGGIPQLNADWRREDQEHAVLSTCSSLITVVQDGKSRVVQFSHFSVKEFLTSDRHAAAVGDISFHHIALAPAHAILAQACLGILVRLDDSTRDTSIQRFPLADYAVRHWVSHALFECVSSRIQDAIENLFDLEKPHFLRWIRILDVDSDDRWPYGDARLEQFKAAPMYYAASCGFTDVVEKLIREHPEHVSARGGPSGTALHAASRRNHLKIAQSLLRHGADVNARGPWGSTPLYLASRLGHLEVGRLLLEYGADVNAMDNLDWSPLILAVSHGHFETVRMLLKHNANIEIRDKAGGTPLHSASFHGYPSVARLLLDNGADPKARDNLQQTPLYVASSARNLDIARLLLERGADVNGEDVMGRTAYQIALDTQLDNVTQSLSAHGVESTVENRPGA